jgi:WhiB family transcriptional regulator, redox-sensing transcriptional regulator
MTARDWRERAACCDVDPELFFPATDIGPLCREQIDRAKAVCARCPVQVECLSFALRYLPEGVAGGLTASERCEARPAAARRRSGAA